MNVYERYHLYNGDTLVGVYSEIPLLEQDLSGMAVGTYVVKKVVETHTVHAVYGAMGNAIPPKRAVPIPVTRSTVTRNHIDYNA